MYQDAGTYSDAGPLWGRFTVSVYPKLPVRRQHTQNSSMVNDKPKDREIGQSVGAEVDSAFDSSVGDEAAGTTGELRRRPEKSREQHHESLADVLLSD